jgi:hypothetical protein
VPRVAAVPHRAARVLRLRLLPARYAICRLPPAAPAPAWAAGDLVVTARTAHALTVVCEEARVPAAAEAERGWRALQVAGHLAFDEVGVLAALAAPLARAGVPLFPAGVWETDYLLVPVGRLDAALEALRDAGHTVE